MTSPSPTTVQPDLMGPSAGPPSAYVDTRTAAIVAGVGYVGLFVLAVFANFVVREGLVVSDDPAATAANIADSGLFRLGMFSFLIVFVLDIVVAWALHVVFRVRRADLSLLAAWSRLVYTVFLGVALIFFFQALQLLSGAGFLDAFPAEQLEAQALVALDTFNAAWLIGLVAFGLHLAVLGYVVVRTGLAPRLLGVVLFVAGLAYMVDTSAMILIADYDDYANFFLALVAVPSVLAEGWFGIWLLTKGGRAS